MKIELMDLVRKCQLRADIKAAICEFQRDLYSLEGSDETRARTVEYAKRNWEYVLKCEVCGALVPGDADSYVERDGWPGFHIHSEIHSMDMDEYYRDGNLHLVCEKCHFEHFKVERYRLAKYGLITYRKPEAWELGRKESEGR